MLQKRIFFFTPFFLFSSLTTSPLQFWHFNFFSQRWAQDRSGQGWIKFGSWPSFWKKNKSASKCKVKELQKKIVYCNHGFGLLYFKEVACGWVFFSRWHKHSSHQSEWGCVRVDEDLTHSTASEQRVFEVQQDDLITKQDFAGEAASGVSLRFRSSKQTIRVNLHSLKCSSLFHFQFILTWKLRGILKE